MYRTILKVLSLRKKLKPFYKNNMFVVVDYCGFSTLCILKSDTLMWLRTLVWPKVMRKNYFLTFEKGPANRHKPLKPKPATNETFSL